MIEPKWKRKAKESKGKSETNPVLAALLVPFWKKLYGISFKDLIGSKHAWCGLFVGAMLSMSGNAVISRGAAAMAWMNYGQKIEWKTNGIPNGAIVQINHKHKCGSGSGNHVAFAAGDCTAADLLKPGAKLTLLGGNQGNKVKDSSYSVLEICAVRWPPEEKLPGKVLKSDQCNTVSNGTESTR